MARKKSSGFRPSEKELPERRSVTKITLHFVHRKSHSADLGANQVLCGEKPAINRLRRYGQPSGLETLFMASG
jgi:hypothetical protein